MATDDEGQPTNADTPQAAAAGHEWVTPIDNVSGPQSRHSPNLLPIAEDSPQSPTAPPEIPYLPPARQQRFQSMDTSSTEQSNPEVTSWNRRESTSTSSSEVLFQFQRLVAPFHSEGHPYAHDRGRRMNASSQQNFHPQAMDHGNAPFLRAGQTASAPASPEMGLRPPTHRQTLNHRSSARWPSRTRRADLESGAGRSRSEEWAHSLSITDVFNPRNVSVATQRGMEERNPLTICPVTPVAFGATTQHDHSGRRVTDGGGIPMSSPLSRVDATSIGKTCGGHVLESQEGALDTEEDKASLTQYPSASEAVQIKHIRKDLEPVAFEKSPWYLMKRDLIFLFRNFSSIRSLFGGADADAPQTALRSKVGQMTMMVVSGFITILCVAIILGGLVVVTAILTVFIRVSRRLQGKRVRQSKGNITLKYRGDDKDRFEKWFFVNGIATTGSGMQAIIDRLHNLTWRKITGLHNRSLGAWFDLCECIIQRDLRINTQNVRLGYKELYEAIRLTEVRKVVLIAHSQGGIIATAWVDQLVRDFPRERLQKLEVYTFASAADHFSCADIRPADETAPINYEYDGSFARVEHFANEFDFVAKFGVLNPDNRNLKDRQQTSVSPTAPSPTGVTAATATEFGRFTGRIIQRPYAGHSMLGHYLFTSKTGGAQSILDVASGHSRLSEYKHGGRPLDGEQAEFFGKDGKPIDPKTFVA